MAELHSAFSRVASRWSTDATISSSDHVINVFVWPVREGDDALPQPRWSGDHGYHVANWTHSGMTYWAISDVDPAELARLTNLLGAK